MKRSNTPSIAAGSSPRRSRTPKPWAALGLSLLVLSPLQALDVNAPNVIAMDNGGPGTTVQGSWPSSNLSGSYGNKSVTDGATGKDTNKSYRYTPAITDPGMYAVYARWLSHANRAPLVPIDINYSGGMDTKTVIQTAGGGIWHLLGTYPFEVGTSGSVLIRTDGTTGHVSTDGMAFERQGDLPGAETIIMDKVSPDSAGIETVGSWSWSTGVAGYHGQGFFHDGANNKGAKSVRFTPPITVTGPYKVYVSWTVHGNRAPVVPITVTHANGTASHTVDQQKPHNQGDWHLLGSYTFTAGGTGNVLISNEETVGYVVVDAVRFVPDLPAVVEVLVDSTAAQHAAYRTIEGSWQASSSTPGGNNGDYLHNKSSGQGAKSVTFTPNLPVAGTYDVYMMWTSDGNRAPVVPIQIQHANGTTDTTVDQQKNGGTWQFIDSFDFEAGMNGSLKIGTTGTEGYFVIADAVLFDLANGNGGPIEPTDPAEPNRVVQYDFSAGHTLAPKNGWTFASPNWSFVPVPGGGTGLPFTYDAVPPGEDDMSEMRFTMPPADEFWIRMRWHMPANYHLRYEGQLEIKNNAAANAGWQVGDTLLGADGTSRGVISRITTDMVYLRDPDRMRYIEAWMGTVTNLTRGNTLVTTDRLRLPVNNKLLAIWSDEYSKEGAGSTIVWQTDRMDDENTDLLLTVGYSAGNYTVTGGVVHGSVVLTPDDYGTYMDFIFHGKYPTTVGGNDGIIRAWIRKQGESTYTQFHNITNAALKKPVSLPASEQPFQRGYLMGWANSGFDEETTFHISKVEYYSARPAVLDVQ